MNFPEVKKSLDDTGCGFCLAKWTQVTMHLGIGLTHSCHHPVQHKIPLSELQRNPTALHNTKYKKEQRKKGLEEERGIALLEFQSKIEDLDRKTQLSELDFEQDLEVNSKDYSPEQRKNANKLIGKYTMLTFKRNINDFKKDLEDVGQQIEGMVESADESSNN